MTLKSNLDILALLAKWGKWKEFLDQISRLILLKGVSREMVEGVIYSLQQAGHNDAASQIGVPATKLFSKYWIFPFITGYCFHSLGEHEKACQYLRLANSIYPYDPQTTKELAKAVAMSEGILIAASEYAEITGCHLADSAGVCLATLSTTYDWAVKTGQVIVDAGDKEDIPFIEPEVIGHTRMQRVALETSNKPFVVELKNARIFSKSSIIVASDGTALSDTGGDKKFGDIVNFCYEKLVVIRQGESVLLDFRGFTTREIESGIFLSGLASDAFGHWLPEFLPKIEFLKKHSEYHNFPIIVDAGMPQSHFDHLRRLTNSPLIYLQPNESLICGRLLVAPSPTFYPVEVFSGNPLVNQINLLSPRALRFIRGDANAVSRSNIRRIFLGRKGRSWRRLLNEDEIANSLKEIGFEYITIEDLSAKEQIELFQEAGCIVAPNGSALLNLVFSDTKTKVLILNQPNLHNWVTLQCPFELMGYKILAVCGDYAVSENHKHSDFSVPIARIYDALDRLGIN